MASIRYVILQAYFTYKGTITRLPVKPTKPQYFSFIEYYTYYCYDIFVTNRLVLRWDTLF